MLSGLKRLSVRCGQQYVSLSTTTSAYGESTVKMWIDGRPVESKTSEWIDLTNPATNEVISRVPKCTQAEMQTAVDSCKKAFDSWKSVSPLTRQQAFFRLQSLIKRDMKKMLITSQRNKGRRCLTQRVMSAEAFRLSSTSALCPHLCSEKLFQMFRVIWIHTHGVFRWESSAGICPFIFPAMIPLWMFPIALATGTQWYSNHLNKIPGACMMLVELAKVSTSTKRGARNGKTGCNRIWEQGIMGVVMPDCNKEQTLNQEQQTRLLYDHGKRTEIDREWQIR
ncbi:hypothetical protein KIN20_010353 [Parelaphostrongylus tenuis]|uniref:Probable methylmalonate-semialdehyde/malonate-semialdehyde dehydrogenase [acylating], mitochondrial n=1 Tax=Parelaphostrongylus tenuis TaxID=148309 RepID=A0AAD5MT99_PARTN|nr:hypothetical protein KIN20_010353 [Parelaphostrongylus tenuis]